MLQKWSLTLKREEHLIAPFLEPHVKLARGNESNWAN